MTQEPDRFLVPVPGLEVPCAWPVGKVVFHPGEQARDLVASTPPRDSPNGFVADVVFEILDSSARGAVAETHGADIAEALEAVRGSLSALRLFQLSRRRFTETTFGLPGDLYMSLIRYVVTREWSAFGGVREGQHAGFKFGDSAQAEWSASAAFQYLSDALQDQCSDGAHRAVIGTLLFDRAALEHRPDLKMIGFASALEAWLLERSAGSQTLRLAQHVAWFGCGAHNNDMCGRSRPICPYLHLSPDNARDRARLGRLRDLGNTHVAWRCSEWHRVMDWYEARSHAAHGGMGVVDAKHADEAEGPLRERVAVLPSTGRRCHERFGLGPRSRRVRGGGRSGAETMTRALDFRGLLDSDRLVNAFVTYEALEGRLAEEMGFDALLVGCAASQIGIYGLPDGTVSLEEVIDQARRVRAMTSIPIFLDLDDAGGTPSRVPRLVRMAEDVGVQAMLIEDIDSLNRYQWRADEGRWDYAWNRLRSASAHASLIHIAANARRNPRSVIVARSDAYYQEGLEATLRRCQTYIEVGADAVFVANLPHHEIGVVSRELAAPLVGSVVGTRSKEEYARLAQDGLRVAFHFVGGQGGRGPARNDRFLQDRQSVAEMAAVFTDGDAEALPPDIYAALQAWFPGGPLKWDPLAGHPASPETTVGATA